MPWAGSTRKNGRAAVAALVYVLLPKGAQARSATGQIRAACQPGSVGKVTKKDFVDAGKCHGPICEFAGQHVLAHQNFDFLVTLVFPWQLETLGSSGTFLIYGLFAAAGLVFVMRILPETKGRSLEELETTLVRI